MHYWNIITQKLLWVLLTADTKEYIQNSIPDFWKVTYKIKQKWHLPKGKEATRKCCEYWIEKHWASDNKEPQTEKSLLQFIQLGSLSIVLQSQEGDTNLSKSAPSFSALCLPLFSKWWYIKQQKTDNMVTLNLAPNYIPYKDDFMKLLFKLKQITLFPWQHRKA